MKVQVTAKFSLDNGEVKKVDWYEIDPILKGHIMEHGEKKPVEIILKSAKEVLNEYKKIFRKYHRENEVFAIEDITGELAGVPFSKVSYWTVKAEEMNEDATKLVNKAVIK
ncbi:hypothetical protein [Paenibacillus sp. NPDC058177]|uniref:hypothetical protein n=1 Tax=Paenibacillus sp. NPDC058177 TaxID=3346369 RepID=UPI0036DCBF6F